LVASSKSIIREKVNVIFVTIVRKAFSVTSIIIPLGRHLRFYVINFRKLIVDTDTNSLFVLWMADMHVYIFAYSEYRSFSWVFPVTDRCYVVLNFISFR
jgi:hypothetical protein